MFCKCLDPVYICVDVRIIRPWFLMRWGGLVSSRICHLAANTKLYLCESVTWISMRKNNAMWIFSKCLINQSATYPMFCGQYSIDTQDHSSYTVTIFKDGLSVWGYEHVKGLIGK